MTAPDKNRELALMVLWQGGECLVQARTHSAEYGISFWGGRVKVDEEPLEAAIRESGEEISQEIERQLRVAKAVSQLGRFCSSGWLINAFQASLKLDLEVEAIEGRAVRMFPMDMWKHEKLMSASRAVLEEYIIKPNGLIDN